MINKTQQLQWVLTALLLMFVTQFLFYFCLSRVVVPWGDGLIAIREFHRDGIVKFLFQPVNEHLVLVPRLVNVLDLHLGYFSLPIAACLTLLLYLYFVWFLARQILFMLPHAFAMALISILAVSVLSTYRLTVLSNPINNSHFLVGFFSAFSIWWAVRAIDGPVDSKRLNWMIAGLLGLAASLDRSNGSRPR